jgi:peptidyl-prolyl cis-trans isomerase SurA
MPNRLLALICLAAPTIMLTCTLSARAQTAAVTIYGDSITEDDVEQRAKLDFLATHRQSTRHDVIRQLADDLDKIREAKKAGFDLTNTQVDNAIAEMCARTRVTPERLMVSLEGQGIRLDTLKIHVKADIARAGLARLRYYKFQDRPFVR